MLSAAGLAAPHLELAVILWSVFTALRTFTNAQSFVKLIVSGPKAAECEEDVAQRAGACSLVKGRALRVQPGFFA